MDELRLEGVHDDGEHLVLSDSSGRRSLLAVDQQLRQAVQRARRAPARRQRQGAEFGPRDVQARFRSGATLDEIVEESGWEPERVRRYEWPILAERSHMAGEAQKVELGARRTEGYRSAFDSAPLSLAQTLQARAPQLGIAATSFDWDAWQRPDLLWTVAVRFRVVDPSKAPQDLVDQQSLAQWVFNPANLSVSPEPGWARHLTQDDEPEAPRDDVFGQRRPAADTGSSDVASSATAAPEDDASPGAAHDTAQPGAEAQPQAPSLRPAAGAEAARLRREDDTRTTEQLLEVLDSRRGQRLGSDEVSDDQLAEILGRSMGRVDSRPRPISAPDDAQLFDQTIQPGRPSQQGSSSDAESSDSAQSADSAATSETEGTGASSQEPKQPQRPVDQDRAPEAAEAEDSDPTHHHEATIHHLGRADAGARQDHADIVEITDEDTAPEPVAPRLSAVPSPEPSAHETPEGSAPEAPQQDDEQQDRPAAEPSQQETSEDAGQVDREDGQRRPRPRGRVGGAKRTRSSVPSWDDIVFGAKND
jgi:hypothetical protein